MDGNRAIAEHYSAIAEVYATLESKRGGVYSEPLVKQLPLQDVVAALDVGTGPGIMIDALRRHAPLATFIALDLSPEMLRFARRKTGAIPVVMDAMNLGFHEGRFDLITFSFSLFHLPIPQRGLEEAARALRPGGHIGVATFADGIRSGARTLIDDLLEEFGAVSPRNLPEYVAEVSPEKDLAGMAEKAGLRVVKSWTQELVYRGDRSGAEVLAFRKHLIDPLPLDRRGELENRLSSALAELTDDAFDVVYPVQYLVARRLDP